MPVRVHPTRVPTVHFSHLILDIPTATKEEPVDLGASCPTDEELLSETAEDVACMLCSDPTINPPQPPLTLKTFSAQEQ
ncbi:hypothetical protein P4O66_006712 [Electrophorus voltai]|uniref:Uncharacterized protein n=1 Tax=Electrophorus voltai TaxID=2609070 RepID=A0AAD8ZH99_9TELE|nr:hypothetical protein P4O66_006712 [Electrophorus voltai]